MEKWIKLITLQSLFEGQIYLIFLVTGLVCLNPPTSFAQEINAYKSIDSGDYDDPSTWAVYDGSTWNPATTKPDLTNDIYIDQTHTVILTANESAKSLFIKAQAEAAQKLNLNENELEIYGSLQGFGGAAPGTPNRAWNSQNWIGSGSDSYIIFKGSSRIIIPEGAWSAQSDRSRYSVIFNPDPGETLVIEEAFKALEFIVRSGTVFQKLDKVTYPEKCSTLSFNSETTIYGPGPFGNLIIEPGATFISECNDDILFRSSTLSASLLEVQDGGTLILEGIEPVMEAENFDFQGKVIFRNETEPITFLTSTFSDSGVPDTFHDLELQGSQDLTIPPELTLTGDVVQTSSAQFLAENSLLTFSGTATQRVIGFALTSGEMTLDKGGGMLQLEENLTVSENFTMENGTLDFGGNSLFINTSLSGNLSYQNGSWLNLPDLTYFGTPSTLDASNGTFPFADRYLGGVRKVQLLGTHEGGNLNVTYTEYPGADHNADFNDNDDTPILYRLYSYFNFSGLSSSSNEVELRISADNLLVGDVEDLRIVGTGYAAPGEHMPGEDLIDLWAKRDLTFSELEGVNFTIGSYRTSSVLPVDWLEVSAKRTDESPIIKWTVTQEKNNQKFEIFRSTNPLNNWKLIGAVKSKGLTHEPREYSFKDDSFVPTAGDVYYQIRQTDKNGDWSWSKIVRLENYQNLESEEFRIFPNPHSSGRVSLFIPEEEYSERLFIEIFDLQGRHLKEFLHDPQTFSEELNSLNSGLFLIRISSKTSSKTLRWIKR